MAHFSHPDRIIFIASGLGGAGALPFFAAAYLSISDLSFIGIAAPSLLAGYGAIILSFLGGLHWGRIASKPALSPVDGVWLIHSIWPSLLGWSALYMPPQTGLPLLAGGFFICGMIDVRLIRAGGFARWMLPLRLILSSCAVISLILAAALAPLS